MATSINTMEVPVSTVQSATAASYTIPADRYGIVRAHVRSGGSLNINGVTVLDSFSTSWQNITSSTMVSQQVATPNTVTGSGGNGTAIYGFGSASQNSHDAGTFKVPAGTVIVGSGTAKYHIELYRIPGSAT